MTRYRLCCTVDTEHLTLVISAVTNAALRGHLDPELTLSLMHADEPVDIGDADAYAGLKAAPNKAPKKLVIKRAKSNGEGWPAAGSIYDTVLQAMADGPKKPEELREALKAKGFSAGSLNASIGRLEKAGKIRKAGEGAWDAA